MKQQFLSFYICVGIGLDQLTPSYIELVYPDPTYKITNVTQRSESQFTKDFNDAFTFSKQTSNYGRRARNKSI